MTTIGSLFSGIGGLELGLERAGLGPVLWQAESDPFCRGVLRHHWPDAHRFESVEEVNVHVAATPTIIAGGFPCQDISAAGKGAGLAGERSGLWRHFARIVRELRPRIVVVENVSALLGRGLGDVLGDLAESGYDAQWDCVPAVAIGAPHRRDRLFLVAWRIPDPGRDGVREQPERRQGGAQSANSRDAEPPHVGAKMADAERDRLQGQLEAGPAARTARGGRIVADGDGGGQQGIGFERETRRRRESGERGHELDRRDMPKWPPAPGDLHAWGRVPAEAQPAVCRLADGLPLGLDWIVGPPRRQALQALGNAVVPDVAQIIGRVVLDRIERAD